MGLLEDVSDEIIKYGDVRTNHNGKQLKSAIQIWRVDLRSRVTCKVIKQKLFKDGDSIYNAIAIFIFDDII